MELLNNSSEDNNSSEPRRSNYQTLISKLKENPELLMQVIPTNKKKVLQNNLMQSDYLANKSSVMKSQMQNNHSPGSAFAFRPSTCSQHEYQVHQYYENMDLNSSEERNHPSTATYYSSKMRSKIYPTSAKNTINKSAFIPANMNYLTKDKILKLSDTEISEYMHKFQNSSYLTDSSGYLFMPGQEMSSPSHFVGFKRAPKKSKYQNNATKLASELFSYYKNPSKVKQKNNSFSIAKQNHNFFNERNKMSIPRADGADVIREVQREDTGHDVKVLAINPTPEIFGQKPIQDYSSEVAK